MVNSPFHGWVNAVGSSIFELMEERVDVEQAGALDELEIPIPAEVAAGVAVEAAAVVEVGRVHDQRVADPVSD